MLLRCLICLLFVWLSPVLSAQDLPDKFDPQRDAARDVIVAQHLAKTTGRRVLVDVGGQWCGWCRKLDRFIASQPQIKALIDSHYVWLKVNYSVENRNTAVLSRCPDGHLKFLHLWPVKFLQAGRLNYQLFDLTVSDFLSW